MAVEVLAKSKKYLVCVPVEVEYCISKNRNINTQDINNFTKIEHFKLIILKLLNNNMYCGRDSKCAGVDI